MNTENKMTISIAPNAQTAQTLRHPVDRRFSVSGAPISPGEPSWLQRGQADPTGRGLLRVARNDGEAAGCGGVQIFGQEYGELKRMYVRPRIGADWPRRCSITSRSTRCVKACPACG
ncbi:MAG: hypothetical protein R2856_34225 [Caldilineaceae bacterium]